tara:strand:- start:3614 stop:4582 length:969 start_codon:yes stop_codon:yes gene_type:complete
LKKKIVWVLTDGSQGMLSQVYGLANHFSNNIVNIKTKLLFPWSVIQPGFLPTYKWIFSNPLDLKNKPDIAISCGRKSVYLSIFLKKILGNKVITIHIQNPKIKFTNFDYVVAPNHDGISGYNVISSIGALHQFSHNQIDLASEVFPSIKNEIIISIMLGGKNRHYKFDYQTAINLIEKIKFLKNKYPNYIFLVIQSRRTNNKIFKMFIDRLKNSALIWNGKDPNPYLFALKYSKAFILTSDSTSMISECAFTQKPIYIFDLPYKRRSKRMEKFHNEFNNLKITQKLLDNLKLSECNYKTLDEAKRISVILKERIVESKNESR